MTYVFLFRVSLVAARFRADKPRDRSFPSLSLFSFAQTVPLRVECYVPLLTLNSTGDTEYPHANEQLEYR